MLVWKGRGDILYRVTTIKYSMLVRAALVLLSFNLATGCSKPEPVEVGYVIFIGDSLTAPYGQVNSGETYPDILSREWGREVVNISKPGLRAVDSREWVRDLVLEASIQKGAPSAVFIALGANDQRDGVSDSEVKAAILDLIDTSQKSGGRVFVIKSIVPIRGWRGYEDMYDNLANEAGVLISSDIISVYLREDGGRDGDLIHPSAVGHEAMARMIDGEFGNLFREK
jgi:lysophospholipase L1-like esterase